MYPAAKAFAEELAANTSMVSIAYTKGLLQHPGSSIEENHLLDSRAIKLGAMSNDGKEGVLAFKERRLPQFRDRLSENVSPWYPWVSAFFHGLVAGEKLTARTVGDNRCQAPSIQALSFSCL